jgi:hypothetical protein
MAIVRTNLESDNRCFRFVSVGVQSAGLVLEIPGAAHVAVQDPNEPRQGVDGRDELYWLGLRVLLSCCDSRRVRSQIVRYTVNRYIDPGLVLAALDAASPGPAS